MKGVSLAPQRVIVADFPEPTPGIGEVLIRVKAAGICRADLSLYHGASVFGLGGEGTIIVGHEPCGVVERVGAGVTSIRPGDRVTVHLFIGCLRCAECRAGFYQHCAQRKVMGFDVHGGDAEFVCVPEANCLPIPPQMSFVEGALSADAIGTLWNAQRRLAVSGADTVAIFGAGPMGAAGVLVAKGLGARVIAIDTLPERLRWAEELGADETIDAEQHDALAALRALTGERRVTVALDCTGNPAAELQALEAVGPHGRVAFVGAATSTTINPREQFIRKQLTVIGAWYFNASDHPAILDFIARNKLRLERLVTHRFSLAEAPEAFVAFDQRRTGKVMFINE